MTWIYFNIKEVSKNNLYRGDNDLLLSYIFRHVSLTYMYVSAYSIGEPKP